MDVLDDLEAEENRLESILSELADDQWTAASAAAGWSVADVVLHLAQTEEMVVRTATGGGLGFSDGARTVEEAVDLIVRTERAEPSVVFVRWKNARSAALAKLRSADPAVPLQWAAAPLKPRALATTRLAEHWAHGLDITGPLDISFPDTDRLRHVAWLAHRSLPYAFSLVGQEPHEVLCELGGPSGETWRYGPPEASSRIAGSAGVFCRVGARRLAPERSGLVTSGPFGDAALRALRNYAA